ncbi:MAG: aldehyde ferredoxin oxidoreductase C-terminal domain-containing protein, partial [Coriobacteriia bacterium]
VGDWNTLSGTRDSGRTTQRPAVLTCGPNAETFGPMAALIHDAGNGAGQGGFGGVFASKNLKAVSVLGTGGVQIADSNALMEARLWSHQYSFAAHRDEPSPFPGQPTFSASPGAYVGSYPAGTQSRPQACVGCVRSCRGRTSTGVANESSCFDFLWYRYEDKELSGGVVTEGTGTATDGAQKAGLNTVALEGLVLWLESLNDLGLIGPGKEIESSLPFDRMGSPEFAELLIDAIITQKDIGADIALGLSECAKKWGRLEQDTTSGILPLQEWGIVHHYDGRTEAEWGYGSLVGERDINEHDFNFPLYWTTTICALSGTEAVPAERAAEIFAKKMAPYHDPMAIDYSDEGIYSESMAKTVAWHRHYTRFWKESILYCDWAWADFLNAYGPDNEGMTGEGEPKFLNAVTGGDLTFEEGIEIGRRIWNLDRAIWILQGRHRDQEVFSGYMYETGAVPGVSAFELPYVLPVYEDGKWSYKNVAGRMLDRERVEQWKTKFFELEGWDPSTGWPLRETLEELDLGHVADALEAAGKLGVA